MKATYYSICQAKLLLLPFNYTQEQFYQWSYIKLTASFNYWKSRTNKLIRTATCSVAPFCEHSVLKYFFQHLRLNQWKNQKTFSDFRNDSFLCVPSKAIFCSLQVWSDTEVLVGIWLQNMITFSLCCDSLFRQILSLFARFPSSSMSQRLLPLGCLPTAAALLYKHSPIPQKPKICPSPCPVLGTNLIFILWNMYTNLLFYIAYFQAL